MTNPLIGNADRDTARKAHERFFAAILELDLDRCNLTYGVAPCTASIGVTGDQECYNTFFSCQDKVNYDKGTHTYKFVTRGGGGPVNEIIRPYLDGVPTGAATEIDPEEGLARRAVVKVKLIDESDNDTEQDPYIATRPQEAGSTFWARLIARNPFYFGRAARLRMGYVVSPWDWDTFVTERYIIDRLIGPGESGVAVQLKDPLKLADLSKVPIPTDGKLLADFKAIEAAGTASSGGTDFIVLDANASAEDDAYNGMEAKLTANKGSGQAKVINDYEGATRKATITGNWAAGAEPDNTTRYEVSALKLTVTPTGKGAIYDEYGTGTWYLALGEEIIKATVRNGDTFTWPDSTHRGQFNTPRQDHREDDEVQLCKVYINEPLTDVVHNLLNLSSINNTLIDTTQLADEEATWLGANYNITAALFEPEAVTTYLKELCQESNAVMWWSPLEQLVKFMVIGPRFDTAPPVWTDETSLTTVSVDREEQLRISQAAFRYALKWPTANRRETQNFLLGDVFIDIDAQGPNEYGVTVPTLHYSRFMGRENRRAANAWSGRKMLELRDAPKRFEIEIDPKDYDAPAGSLVDLETSRYTDIHGQPQRVRALVLKTEDKGSEIKVTLRSTIFDRRFAFIAPASAGDYPSDSEYAHITEANGLMTNGDEGYIIY